jgi:hypothetical protein
MRKNSTRRNFLANKFLEAKLVIILKTQKTHDEGIVREI